jgi:ferredoxin-NADP reductase
MLHQLANSQSERAVWWIHTARDASQQAFAKEADHLLRSLPHAQSRVFYTSPDAAAADRADSVSIGRPTLKSLARLAIPADATAYICGPNSFMQDMGDALQQLGVAPDRIHTEVFGTLPVINPGIVGARSVRPHQPPGPAGTGPTITFTRSDITVRWSDDDRSLLELAEACDVPTRWSCRTGVCHTCVTPVLSGDVAYSPQPLELPADQEALICCARPTDDLVLDL